MLIKILQKRIELAVSKRQKTKSKIYYILKNFIATIDLRLNSIQYVDSKANRKILNMNNFHLILIFFYCLFNYCIILSDEF